MSSPSLSHLPSYRSDSLAARLMKKGGEEAVWALTNALARTLTFEDAPAFVSQEWGVKVSPAAVHNFWKRVGKLLICQKLQAAGNMSSTLIETMRELGMGDESVLQMVKVRALEAMTSEDMDTEERFAWVGSALKAVAAQQRGQRLDQLERQLRASQEAKAAARKDLEGAKETGGLSEEALAKIEQAMRRL